MGRIDDADATMATGARAGRIKAAGAAALFAALAASPTVAQDDGAAPAGDDPIVAATAEWLLDHALAHVLIGRFELDVDGPVVDAADAFASASVSARHPEREAAERLALAAEAMARVGGGDAPPASFVAHDLGPSRAFRVLCVANGADPAVASAALTYASVPDGGFDACLVDRDLATEAWDVLIGPNSAFPDDPPAEVTVSYGPAEDLGEARAALEASGALEALAGEAARLYAFFEPVAVEARSCGDEAPAVGETVVICYESVAAVLALAAADEAGATDETSTGGDATEGETAEGDAPDDDADRADAGASETEAEGVAPGGGGEGTDETGMDETGTGGN